MIMKEILRCYAITLAICLTYSMFLLVIVLAVLHRFTDSDYPLGIFKLFLLMDISYKISISIYSLYALT